MLSNTVHHRKSRSDIWHLLREQRVSLAIFFIFLLYLISINNKLYTWGDNAHYIIIGKSLATGQGLRDIHYPGSPQFTYPLPLFPMLLAPIIYFFGYSLLPMKLLIAAIGVVAVYLVYLLFRDRLGAGQALLLMLLVGVSPQIVSFSHQVMSEIPYLMFSLLALLCVNRYTKEKTWVTRTGLTSAFLLAASCLTRTIGITLLLGSIVSLLWNFPLWRKQQLQKATLLIVVSAVFWTLFNYSILTHMPYIQEFLHRDPYAGGEPAGVAAFLERIAANADAYRTVVPETILYFTYDKPSAAFTVLSLLVTGVGFAYSLLKQRAVTEYYVLFYIMILVLYEPSNYGNARRYIVPLIPFFLFYLVQGVRQLTLWLSRLIRVQKAVTLARHNQSNAFVSVFAPVIVPVVASALLLLNLIATVEVNVLKNRPEMFDYYVFDNWEAYRKMALWTKENVSADSVILTRMIYFYHFWSETDVNWYPFVDPALGQEEILHSIFATNAHYIAIDSLAIDRTAAQEALVQSVRQNSEFFHLVYKEDGNEIYQLLPEIWHRRQQRPLVIQEIRYHARTAGEVVLVWGVDSWLVVPPEMRPEGTEVKELLMYTPMARTDETFVAQLQVPEGTTIDYVFHIVKTQGGASIDIWDTNGGQDYHTVAVQGAVTDVEVTSLLIQEQ